MTILNVAPHLDTEQLGQRYRQAQNFVERTHYLILWHLSQKRSVQEVSEIVGYSERWIFEIARRFNEGGPNGIGDRRRENLGAGNALLTSIQEIDLRIALAFPPPEGGIWNSHKVADWISNKIGRPVSHQRGWDYLKKLGYRLRKPRPQHVKADKEKQQAFKKNF